MIENNPAMNNRYAAYFLLRLALGMSMLTHGLVRMPKLAGFSKRVLAQFQASMLPVGLVKTFSYILPFAELLTGILLVTGMFTRLGLWIGSTVMILLIFGTVMIENWDSILTQLMHIAFFAFLLDFIDHNVYAADKLLERKTAAV